MKKILLMMMAVLVLLLCGCKEDVKVVSETAKIFENGDVVGQGEKAFEFSVKYEDGKSETCTIKTDKETVGDALLENEIISGEDGPYGLYVKTVNGITVDFDKDGKYWAFYVGGEYAMSGVDSTEITAGSTYAFKVE